MSPFAVIFVVVLAVLVLLAALLRVDLHIRRIALFQRRRRTAQNTGSMLTLLERRAKQKYHAPLSDIRDMVISLQLGTSLEATLTGALERTSQLFADRGALGERLRRHVEARLSLSPEAVIEGLAEDLDSEQLREVLNRIRMASEGSLNYNQVLQVSVYTIEEDMRRNIEKEIQQAPIRLTVPMVAGVFLPALVLGLIPLVASGLTQMRAP